MAKTLGVTFAIGAKVNPTVASAFATVEQKIRASQSKMRELSEKAKVLAEADAAKARVMDTQKAYAASGGRDPMLRQALQQELAAFNRAAAAAKRYGVEIADISAAHARADKALAQTRARLEALQKAQSFKAKRQEAAESMRATAAPALAIAVPLKEAIQFESAMAQAAKTIDGMRDSSGQLTAQYYEMEAAVKQMGQTLPLTHEELAKLFAAGGQQGMTAVTDLREFTTMAAQMAVAFDMTTEQAADAIGGYRSALRLTMPEARSLLDLMNQYANTTSASEKGIADIVRRVGSLGSVGGIAAKPMTALAATLDAMKVAPEVAATGIKNLILAMTAGSAATKSQTAAFGKLGIDTVKLARQMQVDGPAAIISVLEAVQKLSQAEQLSTMQQIFGKESLSSIAPLLANLDKVRENLRICADESAYAGAMEQEFANASATTANKLILLKNRMSELGITVAGALLPAIQSITETIGPPISAVAKFAGEHQNLTTAAVGVAAALVGLKLGVAAVTFAVSGIGGAFNLAKAAFTGLSSITRVASAAQLAFNAVMAANPVGLVVTAVAALGAGLVYLYNTCEPVRAIFDSVFSAIGAKIQAVAATFQTVIGKFKSGFNKVKSFLGFGGEEEEPEAAKEPEQVAPPETAAKPEQAVASSEQAQPAAEAVQSAQAVENQQQAAAPETVAANPKAEPELVNTAQPAQVADAQPQAAIPEVAANPKAEPEPVNTAQPAQAAPHPAPVQPQPAPQPPAQPPVLPQPPEPPAQPDIAALLAQMREAARQQETPKAQTPQKPDTQIVQPQVQVQLSVTQNGIPEQSFANGVMSAIKSRQSELEQMISSIVNEQARLAYG